MRFRAIRPLSRTPLYCLIVFLCLPARMLLIPLRAAEPHARPNIVFIFSDDHGYQAISAYGAKLNQDAEHRPSGQGRNAFRPLPCTEFDLRPKPGDGAHRQVLAPQRLLQQHEQPLRRLPGHLPQAAAEGRIPDRHDRQMAPRLRSDRLRLLGNSSRPGAVLQPAHDPQRQAHQARGLRHGHHHRSVARLVESTAIPTSPSC